MIVATHRVVGVLEWPTSSEQAADVLAKVYHELPGQEEPNSCVLSLRLPMTETPSSTVLTADVSRLRRDLQQLFDAFPGER